MDKKQNFRVREDWKRDSCQNVRWGVAVGVVRIKAEGKERDIHSERD